jgi:hypothetical protein
VPYARAGLQLKKLLSVTTRAGLPVLGAEAVLNLHCLPDVLPHHPMGFQMCGAVAGIETPCDLI